MCCLRLRRNAVQNIFVDGLVRRSHAGIYTPICFRFTLLETRLIVRNMLAHPALSFGYENDPLRVIFISLSRVRDRRSFASLHASVTDIRLLANSATPPRRRRASGFRFSYPRHYTRFARFVCLYCTKLELILNRTPATRRARGDAILLRTHWSLTPRPRLRFAAAGAPKISLPFCAAPP